MTITFENDNDVIVYALEKIIYFAKENRYLFVANCAWWIAGVIGFHHDLTIYINKFDKKASEHSRKVSPTPRDIPEDPRSRSPKSHIDPDRLEQLANMSPEVSDKDLTSSKSSIPSGVVNSGNLFPHKSRKDKRQDIKQQKIQPLPRTGSGKVSKQPLTPQQRKYLWRIPKDTIKEYLENKR